MNGKLTYYGRSLRVLLAAFALLISTAATAFALPNEKVPLATDPNYVSAHKYVSPTEIDGVYRVTLSLDTTVTKITPPSLITFVLDGTASMAAPIDAVSPPPYGTDGTDAASNTKTARDIAVRNSIREALVTLMDSSKNQNIDDTYVNVIMFGSHNDAAISLTEWATRPLNNGPKDPGLAAGTAQYKQSRRPGISATGISGPIDAGGPLNQNVYDNTLNNPSIAVSGVEGSPFVKLSSDGTHLNPYLAGIFNMDSSHTSMISSSDMPTATTVSSLYYYGHPEYSSPGVIAQPSYLPDIRFPISYWGTYIAEGMRRAYLDLDAQITTVKNSGNYSAEEIAAMNRTVLVLCDGDDWLIQGTQAWASAIKAPETKTINTFRATGSTSLQGLTNPASYNITGSSTVNGLDAEIWSIVVGNAVSTDPKEADWVNDYSLLTNKAVRNIVTLVAPVSETTADALNTTITNFPADSQQFTSSGPANSWGEYFDIFSNSLQSGELATVKDHYLRADEVSKVQGFFDNFASKSITGGGMSNCIAEDKIGTAFDIYKFPGAPLLETSSSKPNLAGLVNKATTSDNRTIHWEVGTVKESCTLTLSYYVKGNSENIASDMFYPTNEYAYVSFDSVLGVPENYTIYFPHPYVNIASGETKNSETNNGSGTMDTQASSPQSSSGNGLLPAFVSSYAKTAETYTPSVTPNKNSIENEKLQEETAPVPVTQDFFSAKTLVIFLSVAAAASLCIIGWKRSNSKR